MVRLFANRYPELVSGVVLVDAAPENKEIFYEEILTGKHLLKNREYLKNPMLNIEKIDKELQLKFQRLSTRSKIRIAQNSMHFIQKDEPEIIIEEIKKII